MKPSYGQSQDLRRNNLTLLITLVNLMLLPIRLFKIRRIPPWSVRTHQP